VPIVLSGDSDFRLRMHRKPFVGRAPLDLSWIGKGPQGGVQEEGKAKRGLRQREKTPGNERGNRRGLKDISAVYVP